MNYSALREVLRTASVGFEFGLAYLAKLVRE